MCTKGFERMSCSEEPSVAFTPSASPGSRVVICSCVCACPLVTDSCAAHGSRAGRRFSPAAHVERPQLPLEQLGMASASILSLGSPGQSQICAGALGSSISAPLPAEPAAPVGRGAWEAAGSSLLPCPGVPAPPHLPGHIGAGVPIGKGPLQVTAGLKRGSVSLCPGCSPELLCAPA